MVINNNDRKEYMNKYHREYNKTPKRIAWIKNYVRSDKHKKYNNKWQLENKDKVRAKFRRYYLSKKGVVNQLKKHDARRLNIKNADLNLELLELVNNRDTCCVYCKKEFKNKEDRSEFDYDHIHPFKPFSKYNMVKCCKLCNKEKSGSNALEWCNFKGYTPLPIVFELYKKIYSY